MLWSCSMYKAQPGWLCMHCLTGGAGTRSVTPILMQQISSASSMTHSAYQCSAELMAGFTGAFFSSRSVHVGHEAESETPSGPARLTANYGGRITSAKGGQERRGRLRGREESPSPGQTPTSAVALQCPQLPHHSTLWSVTVTQHHR
jgi:hypothetical protein